MASKYTIQVQPQISAADSLKMDQELNRRFSNVAKKFGSNVRNALKKAIKVGLAAAGGAVIGALATNPIEKINHDLDKTLEKADNIATRAAQFGVSTAKFGQLAAVAQSVGLDVDLALQQFSGALQEARDFQAGDKTKNPALVNFLNEKDLVDAFYAFAKEMQSRSADQRNIDTSRIFGDKMGLKLAELLQQDIDKRKLQVLPRGISAEQYGRANDLLAAREDQQALLRAQREIREAIMKSKAIRSGTLIAQDAQERAKLTKEVQQLSEYQIYAKQAMLQERMATALDAMRADLVSFLLPALQMFVEFMPKVAEFFGKIIEAVEKVIATIKKLKFWG